MTSTNILRKEWEREIPSEVKFWEEWIKSKGGQWAYDFKARTNSDTMLEGVVCKYINNMLPVNKILDVGAGPLTILGKKHEKTQLEIYAVDPLADYYNALLKEYDIHPITTTQKGDGERLSDIYAKDYFDITYSVNAIDHSYDPVQIIREMICVAKPNGHIIIEAFLKEGSAGGWLNIHQWDIFSDSNDLILQKHGEKEINISKLFWNKVRTEYINSNTDQRWITVVFKKL